jgi:hypothetical protein
MDRGSMFKDMVALMVALKQSFAHHLAHQHEMVVLNSQAG